MTSLCRTQLRPLVRALDRATTVSVEAEFHYRVIAKELERDQPPGDIKSHIYIFERPEEWQQFQVFGKLEPCSGGIHSAGSLFVQRNPAYKFSINLSRARNCSSRHAPILFGGIPCWLDEGFAHASYQRARGYIAKPHSSAIAPPDLIPLPTLFAMTYPPSDRVETFYNESERLVHFLADTDRPSFLAVLDASARHQRFETAFACTCAGKFAGNRDLEERFRDYAAKDFGTTLQQADND